MPQKKKKPIKDVMLQSSKDRRMLPHVPHTATSERGADRRDDHVYDKRKPQYARYAGQRYDVDFQVKVRIGQRWHVMRCVNISQTGMRLESTDLKLKKKVVQDSVIKTDFRLTEGILQEGAEKHYKINAKVVRIIDDPEKVIVAVQFAEALYQYCAHTRDSYLLVLSAFMMLFISIIVVLMRTESLLYFEKKRLLYGYSILTAFFLLSRYFFGMLYKPVPIDPDYTPSVTIVIPCFNEETWIRRTIISCIDQDYPPEQLEFVIVDDGSSDRSVEVIKQTLNDLTKDGDQYNLRGRIRFFIQKYNQGKREAMGLGIRNCRTEMITFVDSDSFLAPDAIRNLVQPLKNEQVAGVTGRTDVANTYTNNLTRLQAVRYYVSFRIMKAAEAYFDSVMCLSGPLSCYKIDAVREVFDKWLHQEFMGQKATFGDDRSLTNFIVEHHRTYYQDTAICETIVPNRHRVFLRQQMRWKRSWLRESLNAAKFMWRKEPLMALSFYLGLLIPLIAPLIVLYNLVYIPLTLKIFPTTFLLGLLLMSLLFSFAQMFFKKSTIWLYGMLFCLYYECVLLWQMPWAWVTFWVNDWGTRGSGKKKNEQHADKKKEADEESAEEISI